MCHPCPATVGKVLLNGNNVAVIGGEEQISVLKDGDGDACPGTYHRNIIVTPDNTLYVISHGYTDTSAGESSPAIAAGGTLQIESDQIPASGTGEIVFSAAAPIYGVVGEFIENEVLIVIGDDLVVVVAGGENTVSGNIQVFGVTRRYRLRGS